MEYVRKPEWLKVKLNTNKNFAFLKSLVSEERLNTVCEEAKCPNIHECWGEHGTATFMILGDTCTRRCRFCAVKTGMPQRVDELEPVRVGESVKKLNLSHCVITMVNRDELQDGGALIMANTVKAIRARSPQCTIELLTSDFMGKRASVQMVMESEPHIMSHNLETVERLTPFVRSRSTYKRSLDILKMASELSIDMAKDMARNISVKPNKKTDECTNEKIVIKSSMMLGLGENKDEIIQAIKDLYMHGVQIVNLGQYLQPTKQHLAVKKYWSPAEFESLKEAALGIGIEHCEAAPFVRSSYHAGISYEEMRKKIHPLYRE